MSQDYTKFDDLYDLKEVSEGADGAELQYDLSLSGILVNLHTVSKELLILFEKDGDIINEYLRAIKSEQSVYWDTIFYLNKVVYRVQSSYEEGRKPYEWSDSYIIKRSKVMQKVFQDNLDDIKGFSDQKGTELKRLITIIQRISLDMEYINFKVKGLLAVNDFALSKVEELQKLLPGLLKKYVSTSDTPLYKQCKRIIDTILADCEFSKSARKKYVVKEVVERSSAASSIESTSPVNEVEGKPKIVKQSSPVAVEQDNIKADNPINMQEYVKVLAEKESTYFRKKILEQQVVYEHLRGTKASSSVFL